MNDRLCGLLRKFLVVGFTLVLMNACKGQVPPTSHSLTVTVTNAPCTPGTPASTCGYVFSFAVITGSSCPSTTGSNYSPANQAAPVAQPSTGNAQYVNNAAGQTLCAIAQTVAGGAVSSPSTAIGPFAVPANPTAPSVSGQQALDVKPALPQLQPTPGKNELAMLESAKLKAVVK